MDRRVPVHIPHQVFTETFRSGLAREVRWLIDVSRSRFTLLHRDDGAEDDDDDDWNF